MWSDCTRRCQDCGSVHDRCPQPHGEALRANLTVAVHVVDGGDTCEECFLDLRLRQQENGLPLSRCEEEGCRYYVPAPTAPPPLNTQRLHLLPPDPPPSSCSYRVFPR